LAYLSRDPDPESATVAWLIFGAPWSWSGVLGPYYWLAVPLNGLTLYLVIVFCFVVYRKTIGKIQT
jgi:hypothetical protein